ncbi:MAG TPA: hypothetical protein VGQ06_03145 [Gemmatimonadales bacterium]|jgi:hypothetical protein|nr:hypothetical protein [Gemmatimonadales bacterium]
MNRMLTIVLALVAAAALPLGAQGRGPKKEFVVAPPRAMSVTREVLVRQGFEVVRVEVVGNDRVVYYRRGNMGRGKGHGPLVKMIIRRVGDRVVFVDTPAAILVDINVRLRL